MNWISEHLDSKDKQQIKAINCSDLVRDQLPLVWDAIAREVNAVLTEVDNKQGGLIDRAAFSRQSASWRFKRTERPCYEVEVFRHHAAVHVVFDFRSNPMFPDGEPVGIKVEFRCRNSEVVMLMDDELVDVRDLARVILEPLVTGHRPR